MLHCLNIEMRLDMYWNITDTALALALNKAINVASLAVHWIIPAPGPGSEFRKHSGRPMDFASQSVMTISSSVIAGLDF